MIKYIKCDECGEEIPVGLMVYRAKSYAGVYCSPECFTRANGVKERLTEDLADDCFKEVYAK